MFENDALSPEQKIQEAADKLSALGKEERKAELLELIEGGFSKGGKARREALDVAVRVIGLTHDHIVSVVQALASKDIGVVSDAEFLDFIVKVSHGASGICDADISKRITHALLEGEESNPRAGELLVKIFDLKPTYPDLVRYAEEKSGEKLVGADRDFSVGQQLSIKEDGVDTKLPDVRRVFGRKVHGVEISGPGGLVQTRVTKTAHLRVR